MLIIVGIGINSFGEEMIRKIILAGADVLRYNFSYGTIEQNLEYLKIAKKVIYDLNANTKVLIDMPLNKVRLGDFGAKVFAVREGEEFTLKSASYSPDCNVFIPIQLSQLGEKVELNQTITIGEGEIAIQVLDIIDSQTVKIKILNNGIIQFMEMFNIAVNQDITPYIKRYDNIFQNLKTEPEYIAISYINKQVNEQIKQHPYLQMANKYGRPKIIIKIENQNAVDDMEEIAKDGFYQVVLLDRGELGVNLPFQKLGIIQKQVTRIAKRYGRSVFASTQILESTINNYIPSRSEICALTDMLLDGIDGIMMRQETTIGMRPAYSIHVAKKIIAEIEKYKKTNII